jgi:hypothetical protein
VDQDTVSRARCFASTRPGGFRPPPGPTTGVCHKLAGRGAGEGGEIRRMRGLKPLATCTRKRGPETQNPVSSRVYARLRRLFCVMERRKAFPRPLVSGDPEITLRHNYQGAPLGAPSPLMVEGWKLKGWKLKAQPGAFARGNAEVWAIEFKSPGCLKIESEFGVGRGHTVCVIPGRALARARNP